jgi:hypothetical protein
VIEENHQTLLKVDGALASFQTGQLQIQVRSPEACSDTLGNHIYVLNI